MRLVKAIECAIEEGLNDFGWDWESETGRTVIGGYTLRVITALRDNGNHLTRKIYQTIDYDQAKQINDELIRRGIRTYNLHRRLE